MYSYELARRRVTGSSRYEAVDPSAWLRDLISEAEDVLQPDDVAKFDAFVTASHRFSCLGWEPGMAAHWLCYLGSSPQTIGNAEACAFRELGFTRLKGSPRG